MVYNFIDDSNQLPYSFLRGSAVVYNNKIHILGGGGATTQLKQHYSWDGTEWTEESELPYGFVEGSAVVYDNKIHILGGIDNVTSQQKRHYSWDGVEWIEESELPYNFVEGSAVVYNNKIHILGTLLGNNNTKHYSWNGNEWAEESTLPYNFCQGSAVVYNNKIHILGTVLGDNKSKHYSWDGTDWIQKADLPFPFYDGSAVIYNNSIYIFGSGYNKGDEDSRNEYSYYDGNEWSNKYIIDKYYKNGSRSVVYNNEIHIIGGSDDYSKNTHKISKIPINIVKYGNEMVMDISDSSINEEDIKFGSYVYDKSGKLIRGSRPRYFEYASQRINMSKSKEISLKSGSDVHAFYLGDQSIKLRNPSSNPGYAQLVSVKTDQTESVTNILTGIPTTLLDWFRIVDVRYIDKWTVIIIYTYRTANSHAVDSDYAYYSRSIHLKKDGSLYVYAQNTISGTWAANYGCIEDTLIVPMLYPQKTSFEGVIIYRNYYNITTGTLYLRCVPYYMVMRNSVAGDQPYFYFNTNIAASLVNQNANGRVCWPTEYIRIRGGMFFTNASGVASLFLMTKYQTDSSYPFNGAITTFCSDSENISKLKLNIPNKYTGQLTDNNDFLRKLLVMGLLNDNSTLVILRKEFDYEDHGQGYYQYRFLGCWLDFWECNISTKTLVYRSSLELTKEEQSSSVTSNIYSDWYDPNNGTIGFAYLDYNIFYYRKGTSIANINRIQINPMDCSVKELPYITHDYYVNSYYPGNTLLGSHSDPMNNVFIYD